MPACLCDPSLLHGYVRIRIGAMTANYTSDATDAAVQANILAAGYGR